MQIVVVEANGVGLVHVLGKAVAVELRAK